jgi:hypothetical protein
VTFELPPDDPWVARGYGQEPIEPGARPAVLVIDLQAFSAAPRQPRRFIAVRAGGVLPAARATFLAFLGEGEKGWDVHRRYAEVTTADEVVEYLASVTVGVAA